MDTEEDIQEDLLEEGISMYFENITLLGIFELSTHLIDVNIGTTEIEQQEYNFYMSNKDCIDNNIIKDELFNIKDDNYQYNFRIPRNPIPFMDNWCRLPAIFTGKDLL